MSCFVSHMDNELSADCVMRGRTRGASSLLYVVIIVTVVRLRHREHVTNCCCVDEGQAGNLLNDGFSYCIEENWVC